MRETITSGAIEEEEHLLETVRRTIERQGQGRMQVNYRKELSELRALLEDERLPEDIASIVEQMERLKLLERQSAARNRGTADVQSPYFGHLRLMGDDGRRREVLIGRATWIHDGVQIVDWRNAPISRVFYQCRAGDTFEMRIDRHLVEGDVVARRSLTIREGELHRIDTGDETWVKIEGEGWVDLTQDRPQLVGGAGAALRSSAGRAIRRDKHLPEIASLLDPVQFDLITRPDSGLIAIQGSAGSGKTTVALHRVAFLAFNNPKRYAPRRTLILVFSRALASYISAVLPALGVGGVRVWTWEGWAGPIRRRLYPQLPKRIADHTPLVVSRFKQHAAVLGVLEEAAERYPDLEALDIFNLSFTDRAFLGQAMAKHAPEAFTQAELDEVHLWCSRMHAVRDEGGGGEEDEPAIDAEDEALLLRLWQLTRGPLLGDRRRKLSYDHLVVDEAQDLSPVELMVLMRTVKPGAPITLAGDTAQRLHGDNDFQDWSYVLEHLGLAHLSISPLQISYRSTAQIMALARHVLGPLAPDEPLEAPRQGDLPRIFGFGSSGEQITFLSDRLQDVMEVEPDANIAVLTRYAYQADAVYEALDRAALPRLRRVADQDFTFSPGIDVTDIAQSKGLEFDYVLIVDADARTFPASSDARHLLHVGITRAAHMCWLCHFGERSPLLPTSGPLIFDV